VDAAVDRVFLDANVLFSAAWREDSGLRALWRVRHVRLVSSAYAEAEARRNLESAEQHERLDELVAQMDVIADAPSEATIPPEVQLPDKDRPILQAAIDAGADYLLTGDVRHFGPYFGQTIGGVTILRPAEYLRSKKKRNGK